MAGPQIRESVTVAGRTERARVARAFAVGVLGPGHPCGDDAAALVSCSAIVSGIAGRALRAGRSRSRSARGTVLSVWR
jgi:hypothetical protein